MDKEYLTDYQAREEAERQKFLRWLDGDFEFGRDRFPPDSRFVKLQRPVARVSQWYERTEADIWAQVPFCGSLVVPISPAEKHVFNQCYFKASEIPQIVDFVKETGKIQFELTNWPYTYEGLDYLDPIFRELNPPITGLSAWDFMPNDKAYALAKQTFRTFAKGAFGDTAMALAASWWYGNTLKSVFEHNMDAFEDAFIFLHATKHPLLPSLETLMIDDPVQAVYLFEDIQKLILWPLYDSRCDLSNLSIEEISCTHKELPPEYHPKEMRFPCEIGKFLLEKLTYAPSGIRSCYELLDHFDSYDLQKALDALNTGIILNNPDIVNKSTKELSEILDTIWNDPTICRRIVGINVGMPLLIAALGWIAAGPALAAGAGFLSELGFKVADKAVSVLFDGQTTGLSERLAKVRTRSYQTTVYDFKKKYKGKLV